MRLLDATPFTEHSGEVAFRGERVRIRPNQIIAWVSMTIHRVLEPNPAAVPFPVIVDTGHTHSFSIQERHLIEWAGLRQDALFQIGTIREGTDRLPLQAVNLWVHPNNAGTREVSDRPPYFLSATTGVAVYSARNFPRLPLLGLRAIAENNLILRADGKKRLATLRTALRWWPFS